MKTLDLTNKTLTNEDIEDTKIIGNNITILNSNLTRCDLREIDNSKLRGCVMKDCLLPKLTGDTISITDFEIHWKEIRGLFNSLKILETDDNKSVIENNDLKNSK